MKKRFGAAAALALCAAFASVPVLLHGWEWDFPRSVPEGAVKGTIHLGEGYDIPFVGITYLSDMTKACHAAWAFYPWEVVKIINPDPNVNPAITKWMKQNKVTYAITPVRGPDFDFIVIRDNGGTYSTQYYTGTR